MKKLLAVIVFFTAITNWTPSVHANLITIDFEGTVNTVDSPLAGTFSSGQLLSGSYTFESTTPAVAGSTSLFASFNALTAFNFTLGTYSGAGTTGPRIRIGNDPSFGNDQYRVEASTNTGLVGGPIGTYTLKTFDFYLLDSTSTVYTDALILPTDVDPAAFDSSSFSLLFNYFDPDLGFELGAVVRGTLTDIHAVTPAIVPEPGTLALLGAGMVGLIVFGRRNKIG